MLKFSFLIFLTFGVLSCKSDLMDCANSTGTIENYEINPGFFVEIRLEDNIDAIWHRSDSTFIKLQCGRNLKDKVRFTNDGTTLRISNQNKCNWVRSYDQPLKVDIFSPSPRMIQLDGFGDFSTADTLKSGYFLLKHYGNSFARLLVKSDDLGVDFNSAGHLEIAGKSLKGYYFIQGFGKYNAFEFEAKTAWIHMDGQNDARIWVTDKLEGEYVGGRTVFVKGRPENFVQMAGSGKIVFVE